MSRELEHSRAEVLTCLSPLDLMITWGRIQIHDREEPESRRAKEEVLNKKWAIVDGERNLDVSLRRSFESLENRLTPALDLLHGPRSVDLAEVDTDEVMSALEILDSVVFLSEALETCPWAEDLSKESLEKADSLILRVMIDRAPSCLRLVPLNDWRRRARDRIPEHYDYLFPWYFTWADLPSNTLEMLAAHFHEVIHDTYEAIDSIDPETLNVIMAELRADGDLYGRIVDEARVLNTLPHAIDASVTLRAFALHRREVAKRKWTCSVAGFGAEPQIRTPLDGPVWTAADRLEKLFLAAFCFPHLNDEKRINLFSDVEEGLKDLAYTSPPQGSLIDNLSLWSRKELSDEALVKDLSARWMPKAARPVAGSAVSEPDEKQRLLTLVSRIRETPPIRTRLERAIRDLTPSRRAHIVHVLDTLAKWIQPEIHFQVQTPRVRIESGFSDHGALRQMDSIGHQAPLASPIILALHKDESGYPLLAPDPEAHDDYIRLREVLDSTTFHWTGWAIGSGGDVDHLPLQTASAVPCTTLPASGDYRIIVVALTDNKASLSSMLKRHMAPKPRDPDRILTDVRWVFYIREVG